MMDVKNVNRQTDGQIDILIETINNFEFYLNVFTVKTYSRTKFYNSKLNACSNYVKYNFGRFNSLKKF